MRAGSKMRSGNTVAQAADKVFLANMNRITARQKSLVRSPSVEELKTQKTEPDKMIVDTSSYAPIQRSNSATAKGVSKITNETLIAPTQLFKHDTSVVNSAAPEVQVVLADN